VYGSSDTSQYSNEIRNTGATITLWAYIFDAQSKQMLFCKTNSLSNKNIVDKLCIGVHNGYFIGQVYNETLTFDGPVYEGWNFIAVTVQLDGTSTYTRLRVISYARSQMTASYKTFSYKFTDDVDYDLVFGGHYSNDGDTLIDGFAGYMLELRLYSSVLLTLDEIDD
jgi:hypothetical protein